MTKEQLKESVFMKLGFVSMCWTSTPSGVFESTKASQTGQALMNDISVYARQHALEFREYLLSIPADDKEDDELNDYDHYANFIAHQNKQQ